MVTEAQAKADKIVPLVATAGKIKQCLSLQTYLLVLAAEGLTLVERARHGVLELIVPIDHPVCERGWRQGWRRWRPVRSQGKAGFLVLKQCLSLTRNCRGRAETAEVQCVEGRMRGTQAVATIAQL